MDEFEYKKIYQSVNKLPCVFEKAILTRRYNCEKAVHINIAEREATGCNDPAAQQQCHKLLELLRNKAAFSLKMTRVHSSLPHAKEIKIQCGGLNGLQQSLANTNSVSASTENIVGLIQDATRNFQMLDKFPFQEIIKSITAYEGRKRKR